MGEEELRERGLMKSWREEGMRARRCEMILELKRRQSKQKPNNIT